MNILNETNPHFKRQCFLYNATGSITEEIFSEHGQGKHNFLHIRISEVSAEAHLASQPVGTGGCFETFWVTRQLGLNFPDSFRCVHPF